MKKIYIIVASVIFIIAASVVSTIYFFEYRKENWPVIFTEQIIKEFIESSTSYKTISSTINESPKKSEIIIKFVAQNKYGAMVDSIATIVLIPEYEYIKNAIPYIDKHFATKKDFNILRNKFVVQDNFPYKNFSISRFEIVSPDGRKRNISNDDLEKLNQKYDFENSGYPSSLPKLYVPQNEADKFVARNNLGRGNLNISKAYIKIAETAFGDMHQNYIMFLARLNFLNEYINKNLDTSKYIYDIVSPEDEYDMPMINIKTKNNEININIDNILMSVCPKMTSQLFSDGLLMPRYISIKVGVDSYPKYSCDDAIKLHGNTKK
jgi:hypothetical protein